jgi:uncharacterized membrane protein
MIHPIPKPTPIPSSDHVRKVELLISVILRTGVIASLLIVLTGLVLSFTHHSDYFSSPSMLKQITTPGRLVPHTLGEVFTGVRELKGEALITAGLLLLIATPVLRVAVSIFIFLAEKDWPFVLTTTFVLAMLILSFFLGKVEG